MRSLPPRSFAALVLTLIAAAFSASGAAAAPAPVLPPDPTDPVIKIFNPPLFGVQVPDEGFPSEHLHLKLNQAATADTLAAHVCLPGTGYEAVLPWLHLVWKPDGLQGSALSMLLSLVTDPAGFASMLADPDAWPAVGTAGVPVPRDQLGTFELEVFCIEIAAELPPRLGRQSTAYSVEPLAYRDYVADDDPVAWWRMGDLPKGSTHLTDSAGHHDGTYYADGGVHPALDRDGAPNCNVDARATSGCNDATGGGLADFGHGITSGLLNDTDRAVFFTPGQYAAVQDFAAITGAYTIEAWVNPHQVSDMMIFQHGHGPALYIKDGRFVFRQTETDVPQAGGDPPAANHWFHVVGTWDGTSTARLYVNGEEIGSSTSADKVPSGSGSTLYIGNGELTGGATFNGTIDEVAYYDRDLSASRIAFHHTIGTYVQPGDQIVNPLEYYQDVTRPDIHMSFPTDGAVFPAGKVPDASDIEFTYGDPDGLLLDGVFGGDIVVCVPTRTASAFSVTCTDRGGNVKTISHDYTVADFPSTVMNGDQGVVGYWRLGDAADSNVMEGYGTLPSGEYKNDTAGGPTGISGDADTTRLFLGQGGYGYVNGIEHPRWSYTMEAWVKLDDAGDAMIMQHGRGGALYVRDGRIVFRQTVTDVTSTTPASSLVGGWHQVVGVWDGVYARLFIDGRQQGDDVYAPTPPSGFSTLYVGYGEYAPWIRGDMDEVSYYRTALSAGRVLDHFFADPPPPRPRPEACGGTSGSSTPPKKALPPTCIRRSGTTHVSGTGARLVATLPLTAGCPAKAKRPCRAVATLRRAFGRPVLVGANGKTLAAGKRWRVQIRLSASASKLLRAAGRMRVTASVKVRCSGVKPAARTVRLTLRR